MIKKKEFKTTCQGCGKVTFRPYADFDKLIEEEKNESKVGRAANETCWTLGSSTVCLPLGCLFATDSAVQANKRKMSKEDRIKDYCQAFMCKDCFSTALKTEIITHEIE